MARNYQSWGNLPPVEQTVYQVRSTHDPLPATATSLLPYGQGRSYGDSCLNEAGCLLDTSLLNHFLGWDEDTGILKVEAGVTLSEILTAMMPHGWCVPVIPGTQHVTVGGAIGNDVHGKNQPSAGTFGCHVRAFALQRSSGETLTCTENENAELFTATIGGLGLTGLILWAELQLKPVESSLLATESIKCANPDEWLRVMDESIDSHEYSATWIDLAAKGKAFGRGIVWRGNHAKGKGQKKTTPKRLPFVPPFSLVNGLNIKCYNALRYGKQRQKIATGTWSYDQFFFPLDHIANWNALYGRKGMLQYQCTVPRSAMYDLLGVIESSTLRPYLVTYKLFRNHPSPGLLSYPHPGDCLAFDLPCTSAAYELCNQLDVITRSSGGRVYPAKDARMTPESFACYYPQWQEFATYQDPQFSSSFWRRVTTAPS